MSRLPKPPFASGIPSSGLPTPGKRRALSNPQQRSSPFSDLTPEQEALLQEAMERYKPEAATATKEVRNTSSPLNSSALSMGSTNLAGAQTTGPASSQLRKPGQRKQSMSKPSRPALPSLSEMPPLPVTPHSYAAAPTSIQNSPSMRQPLNKANQLRAPATQPQARALSPPSVGSTKLSPIPQRLQAPTADQRPASPSLLLFSVGDRVTVESMNISGTLRFLGPISIKPGVWAGIEMDIQGTGKNDGSIKG